jgi:endonuclease/exonuclease/phosphatase family metal-dependent hydrolase
VRFGLPDGPIPGYPLSIVSSFDYRRRSAIAALIVAIAAAACGDGGGTSTSTNTGGGNHGGSGGGNGGTGGALPPAVPLAVMDWNVHDFFDTVYDNPDEAVPSAADYKAKRAAIGKVIKELAPDVVMFAEVETQAMLQDLAKNELGDAYPSAVVFEGNDMRGINVGLLSKIAPDKVVTHKDEYFTKNGTNGPSYRYTRDCLEVHLTVNGRHMALLGVHFRAKGPPDDPDKRLAEAQHTRAIADGLMAEDPGMGIIVLGDYNDLPASPPVAALAGAAPTLFADSAETVAQAYSYDYQGKKELIDHQLANPKAAAMLDPSTVVIKHGAGIDDGSKYASDHAPIFAVYRVR